VRIWNQIDDEVFFWTTLEKVRNDNVKGFDEMTVDETFRAMMQTGNGRFNPRTLKPRLEQLDGGRTEDWRKIALYLADCHAATTEYDGTLKSVSASRRSRLASICERAAKMVKLGAYMERDRYDGSHGQRTQGDVVERLESAAKGARQAT